MYNCQEKNDAMSLKLHYGLEMISYVSFLQLFANNNNDFRDNKTDRFLSTWSPSILYHIKIKLIVEDGDNSIRNILWSYWNGRQKV